jgi:hypothetical protein
MCQDSGAGKTPEVGTSLLLPSTLLMPIGTKLLAPLVLVDFGFPTFL